MNEVEQTGDSKLGLSVHRMLRNGNILAEKGKYEEAIAVYDQVVERYGEASEPGLREQVAKALFNKGVTLGQLKRSEDAIVVYDQVVARCGEAAEPGLREQVARALVSKGVTLGDLKRSEEEMAVYEQVVARYGEAAEPGLREQVARALLYKGLTLGELKRSEDAIVAYDQVVAWYGEAAEPGLREQVARALVCKGRVFVDLGKYDLAREAIEAANSRGEVSESTRQVAAFVLSGATAGKSKGDLENLLNDILREFPKGKSDEFFQRMDSLGIRTQTFLSPASNFERDLPTTLFLDLREWNSFTPSVPDLHETSRGGGYYIRYKGKGIVIDPGFDFIRNFGTAGGRICDIDHVVITHAHNDHTQDFESILSLVHQYNRRNEKNPKTIYLYLSQGAARKFTGYLPLRDVPYVGEIVILNQGSKENPQKVRLRGLDGSEMTVLRGFHDDTITSDYSVGIGFVFDIDGRKRRVVFTGDTGLFPAKRGSNGKVFEDQAGNQVLDIDVYGSKALYNEYPDEFRNPDLLVPHLGSIKKAEFEEVRRDSSDDKQQEKRLYFYPNHLGLRGLKLLIDKLRPKVVIVGEFGEELKAIRFDLVRGIERLIQARHVANENNVFVVPGDLTVVFDIGAGKLYCHGEKRFMSPEEVAFRELETPKDAAFHCENVERTYFFAKASGGSEKRLANSIRHFYTDVDDYGWPYCKVNWEGTKSQ